MCTGWRTLTAFTWSFLSYEVRYARTPDCHVTLVLAVLPCQHRFYVRKQDPSLGAPPDKQLTGELLTYLLFRHARSTDDGKVHWSRDIATNLTSQKQRSSFWVPGTRQMYRLCLRLTVKQRSIPDTRYLCGTEPCQRLRHY